MIENLNDELVIYFLHVLILSRFHHLNPEDLLEQNIKKVQKRFEFVD